MNRQEAAVRWQQDRAAYEAAGLVLPSVRSYVPDEWRRSDRSIRDLAMDAQPTLSTDPSSAIPALLTTVIDPEVIRIVFAPLQMAEILTERRAGDWLEEVRMFPVVEETGEVSSYGDYNNNGRAGVNLNFPQFQSYLFQTFVNYGERELERAGLARINYVGELGGSAADLLNRYQNLTYAFGVQGLQNYGILNNPYLSAYVTPAVKAWGGTTWFEGSSPAATANEVYADIQALVNKLITQTNGAVDIKAKMTLAMGPTSEVAMTFANSFGVYVSDLLKKGFPNMEVKTAVQYEAQTTANIQGYSTTGNVMQLIVEKIVNQKVVYAAFNEKMRAHKIIPEPSSWKQKTTSGSWGSILRMPVGVVGMLGI
jgi:hypothetical protein